MINVDRNEINDDKKSHVPINEQPTHFQLTSTSLKKKIKLMKLK